MAHFFESREVMSISHIFEKKNLEGPIKNLSLVTLNSSFSSYNLAYERVFEFVRNNR